MNVKMCTRLCVSSKKDLKKRHGSTSCDALLGCNIAAADGLRKAMEEKLFQTFCPEFVKNSGEILESMLDEPEKS